MVPHVSTHLPLSTSHSTACFHASISTDDEEATALFAARLAAFVHTSTLQLLAPPMLVYPTRWRAHVHVPVIELDLTPGAAGASTFDDIEYSEHGELQCAGGAQEVVPALPHAASLLFMRQTWGDGRRCLGRCVMSQLAQTKLCP